MSAGSVDDDITEVRAHSDLLVSADEVKAAIDRVAVQLTRELFSKNPVMLCVLNGGMYFTAELMRRLDFPLQLDYLHATRYRGAIRGDDLQWLARPSTSLAGRVVLVVDDILDHGQTLSAVLQWTREQGAQATFSAVLVDKVLSIERPVAPEFVGLRCADRYLYGCGMDYHTYWRNLPAIYAVRDSFLNRGK